MFVVQLNYKKPLEEVDRYLEAHRSFLEKGYQENCFIVSGPKLPRDGGIIISQLNSKEKLWELIQQDPFYVHDVADFTVIEFSPVKFHADFAPFIKN